MASQTTAPVQTIQNGFNSSPIKQVEEDIMFSRIDRVAPAIAVALALGIGTMGASPPAAAQGSGNASAAQVQGAATASAKKPIDRAEARIAELHAKLHVTAAQDPQWTAFVQAERDSAKEMSELIQDREKHAKSMPKA